MKWHVFNIKFFIFLIYELTFIKNLLQIKKYMSTSHLQSTVQNPQSTQKQTVIKIPEPQKCKTTSELLKYEWIMWGTLTLLLLSTLDKNLSNARIVLYCILFLLLQTIRTTSKCLQMEDPLQLSPFRKFSKEVSLLIQVNLTYLLFRILIDFHNIFSFLLFLHYSVVGMMNFDKTKKSYDMQNQSHALWKMVTPFLLFLFSIIINRNISEVSIIQLILLAFNLVLSLQIKMLLINKECNIFGWEKHGFGDKNHLIFNKYHAVKIIMFSICGSVALQNIVFNLPIINQYASFTMFYSLVLGGYVFYIYRKSVKK